MFGGQGKDGTYIIEHTGSLRAMGILDRDDMIQSFSFRGEPHFLSDAYRILLPKGTTYQTSTSHIP
jgi:hypothetical protein